MNLKRINDMTSRNLTDEVKELLKNVPKIRTSADLYKYADKLGLSYKNAKGKPFGTEVIKGMIAEMLWANEHPGEEMPPQISPMLLKDITAEGKDYVDKTFKKEEWVLQCFQKNTRVRMADGSVKKISEIQEGECVLGWFGDPGRIEVIPTQVTGLYKSPDRRKLLTVQSSRGKVIATPDHKWWVTGSWVQTEDLTATCNIEPSGFSKQLLYGTMLGDASIDKWGCLHLSQSASHAEYVKWLSRVIGMPVANTQEHFVRFKGKSYPTYKKQSIANQYKRIADEFYKGTKVIPDNIGMYLSPALFAAWYMDDGTLTTAESGPHPGKNPNARLCVNQFSVEQLKEVFEYLNYYGFEYKYLEYPCKGKFPTRLISFSAKSTKKFCEFIADFVPSCMNYKMTCLGRGDGLKPEYTYESEPVVVKKFNRASEYVHCIETTTGNFVLASGEMVHNCKLNGQRLILVIEPSGKTHMTSRDRSVKTFRYAELDDHVLGLVNLKSPFKGRTILDGEIIAPYAEITLPSGVKTTSTLQSTVALMHMNSKDSLEFQKQHGSLRFKVFDIIMLDGKSTEDEDYDVRKELTVTACKAIQEANPDCAIDIVPTIEDYESAWDEFEKYVGEGGEGLILKSRKGKYEQGKRTKGQWKLKGRMTVDAFVTGSVPASDDKQFKDYIGGLVFSTNYKGKVIEIASVSNIDFETRKAATAYDKNGNPELNPSWLNRCAELVGQNLKEGSFRLGSARINEWRDDKNPEDCELQEEMVRYDR